MAETQNAPNVPSPTYPDYNNRRLPQPIQLPSLAAATGSPRSEYHSPSTPPLPSLHHGPPLQHHQQQQQLPRSQPRSYMSQGAPIEKILSPHPSSYSPRADSYSPQHSPALSHTEERTLPSTPHYSRQILQRHPAEEQTRNGLHDQAYSTPIDRHRPAYQPGPPPQSSYSPPTSHHSQYRAHPHHAPPHHAAPHHPAVHYSAPHNGAPPPSQYPLQGYPEAPSHAIPPRIMPATAPAPISAPDSERSRLRYELKVRQQPVAARACGFGERDRRVIDPPPIIQLVVTDPETGVVDLDELRYSLNVVHCTLWNASGTGEETALIQPDRRTTRRLMGQLVASPSVAKDEHDNEGCFFCFPDLSCRTHGKYRLRFVLMRIDHKNLRVGGSSPILTEVLTDVFQVYTAKDFPGMRPSSALTRALKLQGCNIQVKKGNEKALARKRLQASSEEEESEKNKKRRFD